MVYEKGNENGFSSIDVDIPEKYVENHYYPESKEITMTKEYSKKWRDNKLKILKKKLSEGTITKSEVAFMKYLLDFDKEVY